VEDLERDLRDMMNRRTQALRTTPTPISTRAVVRRGRLRLAGSIALAGACLLALVVGGVAAGRSLVVDQSLPPANSQPRNGKIVVVGPNYNLYKIDPDSLAVREFLNGASKYFNEYTWSRDGSRIAFLFGWPSGKFEVGKMSLYVANADGSGMHRIVRCPQGRTCDFDSEAGISWSPDGSEIALSADGNLYVVDVDGKTMQRIPDGGVFVQDPAWSPDGSWIAFSLDRLQPADEAGVYLVRPDGSDLTKLTGLAGASSPEWSPDGTRIVFAAFDGLHVAARDGSDMRQLVAAESHEDLEAPSWSPDGTRIAYVNGGVWTVALDGTRKFLLYGSQAVSGGPVWSPDGRYIAISFDAQDAGIIIMKRDGTILHTARRLPAIGASPAWQPIPVPKR
jgi:dipeptidyl aminopeptidase/acylaminoacyl peptidase